MKRSVSMILALILSVFCVSAFAEEAEWYEFSDNVLTVRLSADADANQKWTYSRSDPEVLDVIASETEGNVFTASFACISEVACDAKLSLYRNTWDGMIVEVRTFFLKVDENGVMSIENVTAANAEDDFGVYLNPYGYDLFLIQDLYSPDTSGALMLEGAFGEMAPYMTDTGVVLIGFDTENPKGVMLDEDCRFLVPVSLDDLDNIVEVEDFNAWYEAASELLGFRYSFYAKFEMNKDGAFTQIEYFYLP